MTAQRKALATAGLLLATIGCGGPAPVGPRAYEYAQSLYTLANLKAGDRVNRVAEQIEADASGGELSKREVELLTAVLDDCRAGDWKPAAAAARRIMQDQAKR